MKLGIFITLLFVSSNIFAQQTSTNISVHDPVIIKQDSVYYIFCTGRGICVWSSSNRKEWKREKPVFDTLPWAVQAVPGFKNHIWAPDISY
jgi:arabinan endo-1,5-alpha-L-arabinosidase